MYPDVHFLGGKLLTVWRGVYHEGTRAMKAPLFSPWDITHEGDSQPLVVDLEAASKPSQTFRG